MGKSHLSPAEVNLMSCTKMAGFFVGRHAKYVRIVDSRVMDNGAMALLNLATSLKQNHGRRIPPKEITSLIGFGLSRRSPSSILKKGENTMAQKPGQAKPGQKPGAKPSPKR